ncbi:MAG: hypothetical protein JRH18_07140 [Deltaproteobacteria bacterium]|nr:hypothetical protein [Deltaproteobacteria bacterium]MBW1960442.1 hypothetical protein [Deltaproteobacteria bacterium]MBW2151428.1 hypothetical protein [Deltaproteobacteria bacterium]
MNEKPSDFRFRMDDESAELYLNEDLEDRRLRRLNRKITTLSIIVFCLIGALSFLGYSELTKGVDKLRSADVAKIQKLSEELNSKFSSLSLQFAKLDESVTKLQESFEKLETSFDKKLMPLDELYIVFEKTTSVLKEDMQKVQKAIDELKVSKIDKAEVAMSLEKIEKKIAPYNQHLKNMESEIKALDENLTQELAELSGTLFKVKGELKEFQKLKRDLTTLSSHKIDKQGLQNELKNQERRFEKQLSQLIQKMQERDKTIKEMEEQIQELMKFKALSEIKKRLQPIESSLPGKSASSPKLTTPPATRPSSILMEEQQTPLEPGTIIEQPIQ